MKNICLSLLVLIIFFSCDFDFGHSLNDDGPNSNPSDPMEESLYFPPLAGDDWNTIDPSELDWNVSEIDSLYNLLETNGTRGFIILVDGKIVVEKYFGKDLLNTSDFDSNTNWYWASAGKTLTSFTIGKAQEDGFLSIEDKTSDYLGQGWTSLSLDNENKITIWNQLTMTTGLDDKVSDNHSFSPEDLTFKAEAGTRWAYHNAPYTLLDHVVESAVGDEFENYFNLILRDKIGMNGFWVWIDNDHVYFSTARSMARFGLLISNNGIWKEDEIISDDTYFNAMLNPSQDINESYGYLWWLNGYDSHMLPELQIKFQGSLTPSAPDDMVSGIGKNGQYISIIPSLNMVMVRMGENPDEVPVPLFFQRDIWNQMNNILPE